MIRVINDDAAFFNLPESISILGQEGSKRGAHFLSLSAGLQRGD
jgi:hypothetical protein